MLSVAQSAQSFESVKPARTLTIGPAYSGSSVNVVANRRHALFTHARTQFAAYYDTDHFLVLAKRTLGSDEWVTRRSAFKGNVKDAHNSISLAVDDAGILHVAWDHHDNPLNYARGVRPLDLELARVSGMTGVAEGRVTYRMGSGEWRARKLTQGPLGAWEPTIGNASRNFICSSNLFNSVTATMPRIPAPPPLTSLR